MERVFAWSMVAATILLTTYGQIVLKWQVGRHAPPPFAFMEAWPRVLQLLMRPWVLSAFVAAFMASLCWMLALQKLGQGAATTVYNLGNGNGHSVNEVIAAARRVTGHAIPVRDDPPRAGDPPVLVADATRARTELGWVPQYADIETIIAHAWQWERKGMAQR